METLIAHAIGRFTSKRFIRDGMFLVACYALNKKAEFTAIDISKNLNMGIYSARGLCDRLFTAKILKRVPYSEPLFSFNHEYFKNKKVSACLK